MVDFSDLEDFNPEVIKTQKKKFTCQVCYGTGTFPRRVGKPLPCFACKSRGYFLTSPDKREQQKKYRKSKKPKTRKWGDPL